MAYIVSYQKFINTTVTRELKLPENAEKQRIGTELCTLGNLTYVAIPDSERLPDDQPAEIADSIKIVSVDADLRARIRSASPHVQLINQRVAEKIAAQYTTGDEIKLLRTAPSAEFELYNTYVEDCRAWGRAQKAELGL